MILSRVVDHEPRPGSVVRERDEVGQGDAGRNGRSSGGDGRRLGGGRGGLRRLRGGDLMRPTASEDNLREGGGGVSCDEGSAPHGDPYEDRCTIHHPCESCRRCSTANLTHTSVGI